MASLDTEPHKTSVMLSEEYDRKVREIMDTWTFCPKKVRMVELGIDMLYEERVEED